MINLTDYDVQFTQLASKKSIANQPCHLHVPANRTAALGYVDVHAEHTFQITITAAGNTKAKVNVRELGSVVALFETRDEKVVCSVKLDGQGVQVLMISQIALNPLLRRGRRQKEMVSSQANIISKLQLEIRVIGVSLLAETPVRRELLSLTLSGMMSAYEMSAKEGTSLTLQLSDIQVDNYIEGHEYPVVLRADKSSSVPLPVLEMRLEADCGAAATVYRGLMVRLLPIHLSLDSASLQLFALDFANEVYPSPASHLPPTRQSIGIGIRPKPKQKIYIQSLVIHPVRCFASYAVVPLQNRKLSTSHFDLLPSLGSIHAVKDLELVSTPNFTTYVHNGLPPS